MTAGLLLLIGVAIGIPLGFGLYASLDAKDARERLEREQWSEYFGEQR